jgi:hypothetical protein
MNKSLSQNILKEIDDNHKPAVRVAILRHMVLTPACTRYKGGFTALCHLSCSILWKLRLVVTCLSSCCNLLYKDLYCLQIVVFSVLSNLNMGFLNFAGIVVW